MYVHLRRYPKVTASKETIERSVRDELLPRLRAQEGFVSYCAFWDEHGAGVSVSVFTDQEAAHRATDAARQWMMRHHDFFPERGETKLDLVRYYQVVEEPLLRAMGGRPVLLQRFPNGLRREGRVGGGERQDKEAEAVGRRPDPDGSEVDQARVGDERAEEEHLGHRPRPEALVPAERDVQPNWRPGKAETGQHEEA